jgi:hypothetical protein
MTKPRVYKSIYFEDARSHGKKKGDVTLAFSPDDELYSKIKPLSSSEIKRIIEVNSYQELLAAAEKEYRSAGNFIKHKLRVCLEYGKEDSFS